MPRKANCAPAAAAQARQQTQQAQQPCFRGFGDYDYAVSATRAAAASLVPTAVKPAAAQQMTQQMTQHTQPMTQPHLTQASAPATPLSARYLL
jgi:hypothetical protein